MANLIYEVDGGDGKIYEIEAPEGTSEEDILAPVQMEQFKALGRPSRREEVEEPERTAPSRQEENLFTTNVGRGIDTLQQMYGSTIEGLGSVTGLEGLEGYGTDIVEENKRQLEESAGAARGTEDIPEDPLGYLAATIGAQIPQFGPTLAGGIAGAKLGAQLGDMFGTWRYR